MLFFLAWCINVDVAVEGGFMLNNNSSCLKAFEFNDLTDEFSSNRLLFDQLALQEFILICCQPEIAAMINPLPIKERAVVFVVMEGCVISLVNDLIYITLATVSVD